MVSIRSDSSPSGSSSSQTTPGLPVCPFTSKARSKSTGVVYAYLDGPKMPDGAAEGTTPFRGRIAVILKGPALVQLAFPFEVEKLPADPDNYWRDLKVPCAQFEFAFSEATGIGDHRDSPSREAVV